MNTLNDLRIKYVQAKEDRLNVAYHKAVLMDRLERMLSYAEGKEKEELRKEIFSLQYALDISVPH